MDILLIQPPVHDFYLTQKRTIPYGLACIASALKSEGFDTQIFDALSTHKSKILLWPENFLYLNEFYGRNDISPFALFHFYKHFGYSFQHIGKIARDSRPFLIGISSLFTAYSEQALMTAQITKQWHPHCKIVMGGHHPTHFPKEVLSHPDVDFVIRGEGETSMPMLAKALKTKKDLKDIPGIAFKTDDNDFFIRPPSILNNLDDFPLPDISSIHKRFYRRNGQKGLVITASRGCPLKCSYCSMANDQWTYRKKSISRIIDEIADGLGNEESAFIDFEDENISLDRRWFLELLDQINHHFSDRHLELRSMNGLYPSSLDKDIIVAMKQAGFSALNLSVGTFSSQQQARFMRKDLSTILPEIIQLAKQNHMPTTAYIIAAAPYQLPFESVDDLLTLFSMQTVIGLSIFYPSPGSEDYNQLIKEQLLPKDFSLMRGSVIPISHTTTRIQSLTLLRLTRMINFAQSLIYNNKKVPEPCSCNDVSLNPLDDRQIIGEKLLSFFLYDGIIRGVEKDGLIYQHKTDDHLIHYFLNNFKVPK